LTLFQRRGGQYKYEIVTRSGQLLPLKSDPVEFAAETKLTYRLAVFGTKGCAELLTPEFDFRFSPVPGAPPTGRQAAAESETIQNRGSNTLLAELEAFAAAIRGEAPYPITPEEILHGVAAFEAIIRSAAEHRPVRVARD